MEKVAVAMSGGVDSSVTAMLLKQQGLAVFGLSLRLGNGPDIGWRLGALAAKQLEIPHQVVDVKSSFEDRVLGPVIEAYASGFTPNPCALCNAAIKLPLLWEKARSLGCEALATGHYARLEKGADGFSLKEGADRNKSQAYFLARVEPELFERLLFPLGGMQKGRVKQLAQKAGLGAADNDESQDVCFLPSGGWDQLVAERGMARPGPIEDAQGRLLARHKGLHRYTVGQRRGLGVALGRPAYVTGLDGPRAAVRVGTKEELMAHGLYAQRALWHHLPGEADKLTVRIRYAHPGVGARVHQKGDGMQIIFDKPQRAVAPGQLAVVYRGQTVVGSAWIMQALSFGDER